MYVLAFDTTAAQCSILLQQDGRTIGAYKESMDFGQAEVLIPEIQKLLHQNQMQFKDINLLVVCVGPGSFTGVRASISAARAFGLACPQLSLSGISSFEAYALSLEPEERGELTMVIVETKRCDYYYQTFDSKLNKLSEPCAGNYEELIDLMRGKKVTLIGDGVERFLSKPSGMSLHCLKMLDALPIEYLLTAGVRAFQNKNLDYPKPLYIRSPDVCLKA